MDDKQRDYFEKMFSKYSNMIYRIGITYMKSKSDAEDVTSEVFVKLMERTKDFEGEDHEKAWLIKVAVNMCKNILKSRWFQRVSYDENINSYFATQEEVNLMSQIMDLSPKYRIVIYLHYYEGYKTSEIADMLSLNESTVRNQLARGRKLLKIQMNEGSLSHV